MKLKPIYKDYKNAVFRHNEIVQEKARQRLKVCHRCPLKKVIAGINVCGNCGCALWALTRQDEKICPNWR